MKNSKNSDSNLVVKKKKKKKKTTLKFLLSTSDEKGVSAMTKNNPLTYCKMIL
jgi:bifunctional ADP-heptose synthase (sugar kinase/adenylyltransferase)